MALPCTDATQGSNSNSTNSWLCKLDLNLGNTSWRQEGTYLGGKDLVGQASPDKNISTLRHLEKDFFFDVLYSVLISALFDYLGLWRVSASKVEMINFSAIRCGSWWAKCEKRSGDMCVCFFIPSWLEGSQEIHKTGCHRLIFTACLNVYFWCVYSVSSLHKVM